jgi:cell division protein DivIC
MAKRVSRQTKRRLSLIILITLAVFSVFSYNVWHMFSQVMAKNEEATFLKSEMTRLEDEEAYLKVEVEKLNDPDYVARYARERYLYSKDGEFTIRIPEAQ